MTCRPRRVLPRVAGRRVAHRNRDEDRLRRSRGAWVEEALNAIFDCAEDSAQGSGNSHTRLGGASQRYYLRGVAERDTPLMMSTQEGCLVEGATGQYWPCPQSTRGYARPGQLAFFSINGVGSGCLRGRPRLRGGSGSSFSSG